MIDGREQIIAKMNAMRILSLRAPYGPASILVAIGNLPRLALSVQVCGKPVGIILLAGRAKSDQPGYIRRGKKDVAAIWFCNAKP